MSLDNNNNNNITTFQGQRRTPGSVSAERWDALGGSTSGEEPPEWTTRVPCPSPRDEETDVP